MVILLAYFESCLLNPLTTEFLSCFFTSPCVLQVFDLLKKKARLRVLQDKNQEVQVVGLTEKTVSDMDDILQIISDASKCR